MASTTFAIVPAPPATPPRTGLIPSLSGDFLIDDTGVVVDGHANRWEAGYAYNPEQSCQPMSGNADPCAATKILSGDLDGFVEEIPWLVWAGDKCSTFGFSVRDYKARATRALLACESKQIASEFWTGALAAANGWPNRFLASPDADTLSPPNQAVSSDQALQCLEQGLAECGCGARGMIHATRQLAIEWHMGGALRRENGLILTINDTIVVPDAGYDGSGPYGQPAIASSQWAYATSMVTVRRSPIEVYPDTFGEAVTRETNDVEFRAERYAGATFSGCCHLAVEVNLPLCLSGGAS